VQADYTVILTPPPCLISTKQSKSMPCAKEKEWLAKKMQSENLAETSNVNPALASQASKSATLSMPNVC
jgi:hypothetical protein